MGGDAESWLWLLHLDEVSIPPCRRSAKHKPGLETVSLAHPKHTERLTNIINKIRENHTCLVHYAFRPVTSATSACGTSAHGATGTKSR